MTSVQQFARTQQKEMLQSVETPQTRWEQLGLDIFTLKNTHYLLTVDYFSWFPIVRKLQSLHSVSVIKHLKEIFIEIGVPRCIVSDSGTQFTSQEFKDFTRLWVYSTESHHPPMYSLMAKQNVLYRLLRTVSPKPWKEERTYIKVTYHKCDICATFARTWQKEMLQSVGTPQTRWEQPGLDIFTLKNTHYLLTVDYFSWFPIVIKLSPLSECNQTS